MSRFEEHQTCFYLKNYLTKKFECLPSHDKDVVKLANIDLNNNGSDNDSKIDDSNKEELQFRLNTGSDGKANEEDDSNTFIEMAPSDQNFEVAELLNGRLEGYFVSDNVFNLSHQKLSKAEVPPLSKGLKFCPTPNTIDNSTLKEDLEKFGRKSRLKWHYRNDNRIFHPNAFKPKSKFNPPKRYAAIELYLSRLEEKLLNLGPIKHKYNNLTPGGKKSSV